MLTCFKTISWQCLMDYEKHSVNVAHFLADI
jgi:hypothetical protein